MQTNTLWVVVGVVVLLAAGYLILAQPLGLPVPQPQGGGVACTMEAKICPDGSAVGRTGPNCEFAACPSVSPPPDEGWIACTADAMQCPDGSWVGRTGSNCQFVCPGGGAGGTQIEVRMNQSASALGVTVVPHEVTEDSRCPVDVQCIWAGTVRLRTQLTSDSGTNVQVFVLGTPVTTEAQVVTLVDVLPAPQAGVSIPSGNYRFIFEIKKRQGVLPYNSGIRGVVMAGPTCPVERDPPDPGCADKPVATNISVFRKSDLTHGVAFTTSDARGTFQVSLAPGDYVVMAGSNGVPFPRCTDTSATVDSSGYTQIAVSCDSGIR